VRPAPRDIDELTVAERSAILQRAQVWRPIDTAKLDLLAGPPGEGMLKFDQDVTCTYDYPDKRVSGVTPKFDCALTADDIVKVKYTPKPDANGEVYAEVAGTRLFWALGFPVDRMYPVKVTCLNCPEDPFRESGPEWHLGKSGRVSTKVYELAAIERPVPGEDVEVPGFEGWAWNEIQFVNAQAGGAPRQHVDALKLLAVFVQHVDNKPEQQALICADSNLGKDAQGNATCAQPLLVVKDLGSTFGRSKEMNYDKMKLDSWKSAPIWKDKATCDGHLVRSVIGTLEHPRISEEGRKFLADRLMMLSDAQIRDLFTAARVERRGDTTKDAGGVSRPVTVDDWVRAFKDKRDQIVNHRCPTT
jgi:hypothetical protein